MALNLLSFCLSLQSSHHQNWALYFCCLNLTVFSNFYLIDCWICRSCCLIPKTRIPFLAFHGFSYVGYIWCGWSWTKWGPDEQHSMKHKPYLARHMKFSRRNKKWTEYLFKSKTGLTLKSRLILNMQPRPQNSDPIASDSWGMYYHTGFELEYFRVLGYSMSTEMLLLLLQEFRGKKWFLIALSGHTRYMIWIRFVWFTSTI